MMKIKTSQRRAVRMETVEEFWTPESIREIFEDDSNGLVMQLLEYAEKLEEFIINMDCEGEWCGKSPCYSFGKLISSGLCKPCKFRKGMNDENMV